MEPSEKHNLASKCKPEFRSVECTDVGIHILLETSIQKNEMSDRQGRREGSLGQEQSLDWKRLGEMERASV